MLKEIQNASIASLRKVEDGRTPKKSTVSLEQLCPDEETYHSLMEEALFVRLPFYSKPLLRTNLSSSMFRKSTGLTSNHIPLNQCSFHCPPSVVKN